MLIDCLYFTKVFFNGICRYVCPDMKLYFFSYLILSAKVEPRPAKVISHSPHLSCVCDTLILFSLLWLLIVHQATMPKTEQPELFSSTLGINLIINEPKSSKITNILDFFKYYVVHLLIYLTVSLHYLTLITKLHLLSNPRPLDFLVLNDGSSLKYKNITLF